MAQLVVRQLEESVVQKLRERAAQDGVSMEEEHRRILRAALCPDPSKTKSFKAHLLAIPTVGEDWMFERKRSTNSRSVDLE